MPPPRRAHRVATRVLSLSMVASLAWTDSLDKDKLHRVLSGQDPFDETTMLDDLGAEPVPVESPRSPSEPTAPVSA